MPYMLWSGMPRTPYILYNDAVAAAWRFRASLLVIL